ncbi:hypothetical protein D3C75_1127960 [compost metagenome]
MVNNKVHHQLDAACVQPVQQLLPVGKCAELIHNVFVITDIIAVVVIWRLVDRGQPDDIHSQLLQIIEAGDNPPQISDSVSVAVLEAAWINLINYGFFPKGSVHAN